MNEWGGKREGAGRPRGSVDKRLNGLRELLDPHAQALVAQAVDLALGGDTQALKMCLDRIIPPLKSEAVPVSLKFCGDSLADKAKAVLAMGGTGELSVTELTSLMQTISTMARIIDVDDLERRIATLENGS